MPLQRPARVAVEGRSSTRALFLHLGFGGCTDVDDGNAAPQRALARRSWSSRGVSLVVSSIWRRIVHSAGDAFEYRHLNDGVFSW